MNQNELTKTFMMISNWNKPFGLHDFTKLFKRCKDYVNISIAVQRQTAATAYLNKQLQLFVFAGRYNYLHVQKKIVSVSMWLHTYHPLDSEWSYMT